MCIENACHLFVIMVIKHFITSSCTKYWIIETLKKLRYVCINKLSISLMLHWVLRVIFLRSQWGVTQQLTIKCFWFFYWNVLHNESPCSTDMHLRRLNFLKKRLRFNIEIFPLKHRWYLENMKKAAFSIRFVICL